MRLLQAMLVLKMETQVKSIQNVDGVQGTEI